VRLGQARQYFPCVLVANKSELRSQACVAKEEGHSLGQQLQSPCIPVSAKNASEGKALFISLLAQIFSFGTEEFAGTIMEQQDLRSRRTTRRKSSRLRLVNRRAIRIWCSRGGLDSLNFGVCVRK
jgi:hypothetical protein